MVLLAVYSCTDSPSGSASVHSHGPQDRSAIQERQRHSK
uniref:Uncharacterized protein n=1 Tax=Timema poppense TaxID=170557 RepID=A0A7R9DVZ7_TIMPO|nr:unnamed protein product [Timema poppensis]